MQTVSRHTKLLISAVTLVTLCGIATAATQDVTTVAQADAFKRFDANRDGYIDQAEAAASAELNRLFDSADHNKDGKLNVAEFSEILNGPAR